MEKTAYWGTSWSALPRRILVGWSKSNTSNYVQKQLQYHATINLFVCQSLRPLIQLTNTMEYSQSREANSSFSQFYGTWRFMTVLTIAINCTLSQTNSVNAFLSQLCKRHFNIIVPLRSKWSPSSMIPHQISSSALCSQKPSVFVLQLPWDRMFHTPICQLHNR
jgi:hypothetical protein